ncbi:MAG TPA: methylenetetrahydrofolate reductase, partial [Rhizobiaceae bacterium]|nr:methylenetetrahydrofolate reductase [Rhizobiaceae bacterium]
MAAIETLAMKVREARDKLAFKPAGVSPNRRARRRYTIRLWAVRHSRFLE